MKDVLSEQAGKGKTQGEQNRGCIVLAVALALLIVCVVSLQGCYPGSSVQTQSEEQENYSHLESENSSLRNQISELEQDVSRLEEELEYKNLAIEEREETVYMLEDLLANYGSGYWYEYQWSYG